jgi:hypothetical protein
MKKTTTFFILLFSIQLFSFTSDTKTNNYKISFQEKQDKNAPACNCGPWGGITVQNSPKRYNCGSIIEWKCKELFNFSTNYQCVPGSTRCQATTSWVIKKGSTVIKTGNSNFNITDNFTPTTSGSYTIILYAVCNGKKCEPCNYTINVVCR